MDPLTHPTFRSALVYWLKLGCISFGGPAGQIAIMHAELVDRRRWISDSHFLHALNFCTLLPGPEAQQLATYLGWRLHGWRGGVVAGALFVLPSAVLLWALAWFYMRGGSVPWVAAVFHGLVPAVIALLAAALLRIGKKALHTPVQYAAAVLACVLVFAGVSFVFVVLGAGLLGWLIPYYFPASAAHGKGGAHGADDGFLKLPPCPAPTWSRAATVLVVGLALWCLPLLALGAGLGWQSVPARQGVFFSQAAMVTFGGAYAVLPYVAQQAVEHYGWLSQVQMMAGLGLAETTPGPLIMVLQFVGFVGAWQHPGALAPLWSATLGAFAATWATFLPSFIMVFLGAPYVESLRAKPRLGAALAAITAAVVGVILNLAVWFTVHALWPAGWAGHFDWPTAFVAVGAFLALHCWKVNIPACIGGCAVLGMIRWVSGI